MNTNNLKEELTEENIILLMKYLGVEKYEERKDALIFPTICHNVNIDDASMKLYYYKKNKLFHCYTQCGESFDIYGLFKRFYEIRQMKYNFYDDIYYKIIGLLNLSFLDNVFEDKYISIRKKFVKENKTIILPEYDTGVLSVYIKSYPIEWLNDNISTSSMDKFNILYSISENKIIIPHYDYNNRLVGIRGRALNKLDIEKNGKYMPVQIEGRWYSHPLSMNLYGLNVTKEIIKSNKICYLFEAEKSVLQIESYGMLNCSVAVCGSNLNKFQINLLMRECAPKEIVLCFDNEEKNKEDKYFNKLWDVCKKYNNYCNFSFIYDRDGLLEYKDSPSDKGRDIFEELLKGRVRIK